MTTARSVQAVRARARSAPPRSAAPRSAEARPSSRALVTLVIATLVAAGCGGGPILANDPISFATPAPATSAPQRPADPIPIGFPRDDGPHDRLTEWWYYTGHLETETGRRFGFEAVVFRAERSAVPAAWAAHLALTDEANSRFAYAQRSEIGPQVDRSPRDAGGAPTGFDLNVSGLSPTLIAAGAPPFAAAPWQLAGSNGTDRIVADLTPEEAAEANAAFGLTLDLRPLKEPALHEGDGFIDFGPAGSSYYYSRTRLEASGEIRLDGATLAVEGIAWFDHQWGDFVSVGEGGWDWFAINLDDGTDITVSAVKDDRANIVFQYGTVVAPDGTVRHIAGNEIGVGSGNSWTSLRTGRTWPASWALILDGWIIQLEPTIPDQELDTRATTGVIYWEGSQNVVVLDGEDGTRLDIGGEAYVEITRYAP